MVEPHQAKSDGGFFATIFVMIGLIWMTVTGLCTGSVALWTGFINGADYFGGREGIGEFLDNFAFVLAIGAACFAPGLVFWLIGKALRRGS